MTAGIASYFVTLTCGHDFTEHRPPSVVAPVEGEMRACGHPEHYPRQFAASCRRIVEDGEAVTGVP